MPQNQWLSCLASKFTRKEFSVGIVGLGYVGLPLALAYAKAGFKTIGFDIDPLKVLALSEGRSYIKHIGEEAVAEVVHSGLLTATADFAQAASVDALILCVPTPLDKHFEPDLSYVTSTLDALMPFLREGQIVSLESTTYPGTTDEEVVTRIATKGFEVGENIFVVYSPEREDPGNPTFSATNIPKVIGGTTPSCLEAGLLLYGQVFEKTVPVSSTKVAELTKLLENIYRAVNIGLVNELKVVADKMGIDIWEVIQAASTKPFGFTPFYPGPGLGGHCIPIDPFYLTWKAKEYGVHTRFIELAGQINTSMPDFVVHKTMLGLNQKGKSISGSKILVLGLAYKANVDDMRESPTFVLMDQFRELGAMVDYYDPYISEIGPTREHKAWQGKKSIEWNREVISAFDAIVLSTNHSSYDLNQLGNWAQIIVDTRNAMNNTKDIGAVILKA